jgi:hypothetical protein
MADLKVPPSPTASAYSSSSTSTNTSNSKKNGPPQTVTNVDDPSHPLHHHRRIVTDFEYGDVLGEGSYSTVRHAYTCSIYDSFPMQIGADWT